MKKVNYVPVLKFANKMIKHYGQELKVISPEKLSDYEAQKSALLTKEHNCTDVTEAIVWNALRISWDLEQNKHITHYFIQDDSLLEFLKTTTVTPKSIKTLIDDYGIDSDTGNDKYIPMAIHTKSFGCVFMPVLFKEYGKYAVMRLHDFNDKVEFVKEDLTDNQLQNEELKLLTNLLFYIYAFPEQVTDGVPGDYIVSSVGSVKNKVIRLSEKVCHKDSSGKAAHFRTGFFRHYPKDSEHWVNVRGQVRWIEGTTVNGFKAKTVKDLV